MALNVNDNVATGCVLFLAEHTERGTFDRLNLSGGILGNSLTIAAEPYDLCSTIVVLSQNALSWADIVSVSYANETLAGESVSGKFQLKADIALADPEGENEGIFFLALPISLEIRAGTLEIEVEAAGRRYARAWSVIVGNAPHRRKGLASNPDAGLLGPKRSLDISGLLDQATSSVDIVDQYCPPDVVERWCASLSDVHVRALTHHRQRPRYRATANALRHRVRTFDVRFSRKFHDRFLVLNGNEVFFSGHSFKDLGGRYSFFAAVHGQDATEAILREYTTVWQQADTLES